MSEIETDPDDPVILAGEYALGVLEGSELANAQRRYLADSGFAYAVEWWQYRLGQLGETVDGVAPSSLVWPAIAARLAAQEQDIGQIVSTGGRRAGLSGWALGGALATSAAAAAALVLWLHNPAPSLVPVAPTPQQTQTVAQAQPQPTQAFEAGPQLIVQARDEDGRQLVSRIIPDRDKLIGRVEGLQPDNPETHSAELWVVPADGQPRSLGLIPSAGDFSRDLSAREARLLTEGATLAVTIEPRTGAPHDAPTTPILLSAPLAKL